MDSTITNNKNDIHVISHEFLKIWFKKQDNRKQAFGNLHEALKKCKLQMLADELIKGMDKTIPKKPSTGILQHVHVYQLSQKITNIGVLKTLAFRGLNLEIEDMDPVISNYPNDVQSSAHEVLKMWFQKQTTEEAFGSLHEALLECEMKKLLSQLRKWVEGTKGPLHLSDEHMFQIYFLLTKYLTQIN